MKSIGLIWIGPRKRKGIVKFFVLSAICTKIWRRQAPKFLEMFIQQNSVSIFSCESFDHNNGKGLILLQRSKPLEIETSETKVYIIVSSFWRKP